MSEAMEAWSEAHAKLSDYYYVQSQRNEKSFKETFLPQLPKEVKPLFFHFHTILDMKRKVSKLMFYE